MRLKIAAKTNAELVTNMNETSDLAVMSGGGDARQRDKLLGRQLYPMIPDRLNHKQGWRANASVGGSAWGHCIDSEGPSVVREKMGLFHCWVRMTVGRESHLGGMNGRV